MFMGSMQANTPLFSSRRSSVIAATTAFKIMLSVCPRIQHTVRAEPVRNLSGQNAPTRLLTGSTRVLRNHALSKPGWPDFSLRGFLNLTRFQGQFISFRLAKSPHDHAVSCKRSDLPV